MDRSFFVVMALAIGLVLGLIVDMTMNKGRVAAQHLHHEFPGCSSTCHG